MKSFLITDDHLRKATLAMELYQDATQHCLAAQAAKEAFKTDDVHCRMSDISIDNTMYKLDATSVWLINMFVSKAYNRVQHFLPHRASLRKVKGAKE